MVHRSRARSSSLFLMELILAILFFSVASAVCVEFFVKSHLMSQDSEKLTRAVNECSGAAEIVCTSDSLAEGLSLLQQQYPEGEYPDLGNYDFAGSPVGAGDLDAKADVKIYYDDFFVPCEESAAAYVLGIHLTQKEQMIEAVVEMREEGDREADLPVYQLNTKHHIARRTEYSER
mgnify:CR=1 FL=1